MPETTPPQLTSPTVSVEDDRTGMHPVVLRRAFTDHVQFSRSRDLDGATPFDRYMALAYSVRDRLVQRWAKTQRTYYEKDVKRAYYLSAEFLLGRALVSNLQALGIYEDYRAVLGEMGIDLDELVEREPDAGLGNGGLGRLAACLLSPSRRLAIRAAATESATSSASSNRSFATARRLNAPTNGFGSATLGKSHDQSTRSPFSLVGTPSLFQTVTAGSA